MKEIQLKELQRMINFIEAVGCQYKIITPDGEEFGKLETKPARKRRERRHEYGELIAFYKPQVDLESAIGSVQEISVGDFQAEEIRSGVCSMLSKAWGKEAYTTSINRKTNKIEVLRIV